MTYLAETTVYMTVTAILILVFKAVLGHRLSGRWQVWIWSLLLIRFLVPGLPESPVSVFNAVPPAAYTAVSDRTAPAEPLTQPVLETKAEPVATEVPEVSAAASFWDWNTAGIWIWGSGAVILLIYFLTAWLICLRQIRQMEPVRDPERLRLLTDCCNRLSIRRKVSLVTGGETPMLAGLIRPRIILPAGYSDAEVQDVMMHELCHLKNGDIAVIWLGVLVLCLNWFNPVLWYSFFVLRRDIELYCDQRVLKFTESKKAYAGLLLKTALRNNKFMLGTTALQNGGREVKRRIRYMAYGKPTVLWSTAVPVLAAVLAAICLTNGADGGSRMSQEKLDSFGDHYVGSMMADMAYADENRAVFYYLDGVFVYDLQQNQMKWAFDLSTLNTVPFQQGDLGLTASVSADGGSMLLTPVGSSESIQNYDNYLLNLNKGKAAKTALTVLPDPFTGLGSSYDRFSQPHGWLSEHYAESNSYFYYLTLENSGSLRSVQLMQVEKTSGKLQAFYVFNGGEKPLSKEEQLRAVLPEGAHIVVNGGAEWEGVVEASRLNSLAAELPFDLETEASKRGFTSADYLNSVIETRLYEIQLSDGSVHTYVFFFSGDRLLTWQDLENANNEQLAIRLLNRLYRPAESALYEQTAQYLESEFERTWGAYYEILAVKISNWAEADGAATFLCSLIHKNFDKDPDTVGYIKALKEKGDVETYQQLRNEYLMPQTTNFEFKVIAGAKGLELYHNAAPKGTEWVPVQLEDFIGEGE